MITTTISDSKGLELSASGKKLLDKLVTKNATIGVVGLGYVGLPLAVEKAKAGYKVIGFDVQESRVNLVNSGTNYIGDVVDAELADITSTKQFIATTDFSLLADVDAVAICVPTPLDTYQQPDISYVKASSVEISKYIHPGMLVVLESTTFPGTTEEVVRPILEESRLICGIDFFLAYSPERVDPGNKDFNTKNTPKVVGGITAACTKLASTLYSNVLEGEVHEVSTPAVAEMEKILENTFRNINIALANEMAILCDKMGIDVWEVIEAAKTKPYGFMAFYPGPGLGGHCIPIDPFYLTWKAREYNYHTRLIETAAEINNYMPEFVVNKIIELLNNEKKSLNGSRVLLLGVAYKKDIDDLRESPVLKIIDILKNYGATVEYCDPYVPEFRHKGNQYKSIDITCDSLQNSDITVITTEHTNFPYDLIGKNSKILFDTRNAIKNKNDISVPYYKL